MDTFSDQNLAGRKRIIRANVTCYHNTEGKKSYRSRDRLRSNRGAENCAVSGFPDSVMRVLMIGRVQNFLLISDHFFPKLTFSLSNDWSFGRVGYLGLVIILGLKRGAGSKTD